MTQRPTPSGPDWPSHHSDAPPSAGPRSLRRGVLAGVAVLMMASIVLVAGGWSTQTGGLIAGLTWIAAVGFGALAYRGRPPVVLTLTKLALVLGIISLALAILLLLLSSEVRHILVGSVSFGTSGVGCTVEHEADSFVDGEPIYQVAHLTRTVESGEVVVLSTRSAANADSETTSSSTGSFDCMAGAAEADGPGHYAVTVTVGDEVLAEGAYEIRPAVE